MSLRIKGIGVAVPEHAMAQADAAELLVSLLAGKGRARTVQALYARSGINKRHSVLLEHSQGPISERQAFYSPARDETDRGPTTAARMQRFEAEAPPLAAKAASTAMETAGLTPEEVTDLVTISCTGFFSPGLDAALIERLGLKNTVERSHVGFMGCHGAMNGLRVASAIAGADPAARVLMVSAELCSLHLAFGWNPQDLVANALFSDGAAAVVGVPASLDETDGDWRVAASGTLLFPDSAEAMSWRIADNGFRMTLSPRVPGLIQEHVGAWLKGWLAEQGLAMQDIRTWAVHPGGPRVLTAFGKGVGLDREVFSTSRGVLADFGNMSSATLLFILDRLRKEDAQGPVVALAFGPGLVAEVALLL